jgi:glutaredoxin
LSPEAKLADCLTASGAKVYGASWCPHCRRQKEAFGDAVDRLNYIECVDKTTATGQAVACTEAKITSLPTWIFGDGTRETGRRPLDYLAEKSGCEWDG